MSEFGNVTNDCQLIVLPQFWVVTFQGRRRKNFEVVVLDPTGDVTYYYVRSQTGVRGPEEGMTLCVYTMSLFQKGSRVRHIKTFSGNVTMKF